ncbi:hypothetical protein OESDEN_08973 [Oesophagostomum dentatum]|uniref:Myosin tail domain-containing protein n=1 Tax=Oesophagostomum dentatum TaxID=61180 RepID=A0A0B1T736_OESDE|nr:hypothetical protein OESDEN_08973 [Oesophagostomum dentatum]
MCEGEIREKLEFERTNSRYKAERRRASELEEELNTASSKCRELSRQLLDANEVNDALTREINGLRARAAMASDRRLMSSSRDMRRFGSSNSLSRGEDFVPVFPRNTSSVGGSDAGEARPSSRTTPGGSTYGQSEDGDSTKT